MRPKIICHMISSLDGRLDPQRWSDPAQARIDDLIEMHYEAVAATLGGEGWIVGRRTMASFVEQREPPVLLDMPVERDNYFADRSGRALAIAIDPSGRLCFRQDHIGGDHAVVLLSERVPDASLQALKQVGVSYVFAGPEGDQLARALAAIGAAFGVLCLLLEGGGITNGAFWATGLIDEISTLVCPTVDGLKGIPAIFDYVGPAENLPAVGQHLSLRSCEVLEGGVVWLRHEVTHADVS